MTSQVERILAQWHTEKPQLDVSPMAVIGRLSRAASAVEARIAANFAAQGLDSPTFDVLATLLRSGLPHSLTPAVLARDAMISTSAVAQRLNKLEARGLVSRTANPDDGRGTLVSLTPAGRNLVEAALPTHLATERSITGTLSKDEQALLAKLLEKITDAAS
ncbi:MULTISPECIES: MarR family winged helix-turn-helix transcriptional regulator [Arthrobacter]|uniref:MarR family transcriptional regulator n=1 Tax=Arthrobacter psychrochitiniphilus TaxID=291045 RepID=A0A2V3DQA8_9MICC|nr:MarR family transcriptional regulator [Arthrobacter psychrochitiniphilus]NYG18260.1 DNA-binding MarR family transcriptional regulator [Arthrobacter psychrochitiniphilus]PXA64947.1 MarR family transcriptional regulator [Arthrobacter psychrochitiniphilus]